MKVLVRDRREGKTTELIKWLLKGKEQDVYPYWSRVIVAANRRRVVYTTEMVQRCINEWNWDPCTQMLPHVVEQCKVQHRGLLTDVRKAVWCFDDLHTNLRGTRPFEYAVDDADVFFRGGGMYRLDAVRTPAVIVLTGELVDDLCD